MKSKGFGNKLKKKFIENIPSNSIESSDLIGRSKFNFSFLDINQEAGYQVGRMAEAQLRDLVEKVRLYSREPLQYWQNQRSGAGGLKILEIYGRFPANSDFVHPQSVPHDVRWARFRMDNLGRLVGFVVPAEYSFKRDVRDVFSYDCNTFYVVFIDLDHRFYKTENR